MGLTIHYQLSVAKNLSGAVVCELAQRTALYAEKIGCAEAGEVLRVDDSGLSVESPIFDYFHFERLEHEGRREFGGQIAQLQKEVRQGLF